MNRVAAFLCFFLPLSGLAQVPDFKAAEKYDVPNLQKLVGSTQVIPFFLKKSNRFWFVTSKPSSRAQLLNEGNRLKDLAAANSAGEEVVTVSVKGGASTSLNTIDLDRGNYYIVDPDKKKKQPLFDKVSIAYSLQKLTQGAPAKAVVNYNPQFSEDEETVQVGYNGETYDYNYTTKKLVKQVKKAVERRNSYAVGAYSMDKKWLLYARNHNLILKNTLDTTAYQLSADGVNNYTFSINDDDRFAKSDTQTDAVWSPDSKTFYVLRKDIRKVQTLTVVNSLTSMGRPYVNTYKYELPGDKEVAQYHFYVGNAESHTLKEINIDRWPDQEVEVLRNQNSDKEVFLLRKKRTREEMELCAVDLTTGTLRVVISEVSKPFINQDLFNVSVLNKGKDILWWSDRTGWGQYYHYDNSGKLLNAITKGDWTAGKIAAIDTAKRELYFYGYGKEKGRNPNYAFVYKTGIDGAKEPQLLTPEDATHAVFISPSRAYFVDNFSRIDLEPSTVVRDKNGKFVMEVLKSDMSELYAYGWKKPEMFTVKAKDSITDLYGLMWKPFNFDPSKKYPIISQVYPGPFTETVWNDFTIFDRYNNTALAQMGFIVVVMGHRGGSPYRNAKYYKFGHGNLRDYALEDDKYGLEQLGARFNYIDLTKVGIFGHSGGGAMSTTAMCTYPEFYKVAVSSSGNHDNTIYNRTWGESYQGFEKKMDLNQTLAKNLKGHLLLVTGESDQNVNPAGTYRMADALIKANKDFDLLVLPGQSHTYEEPYKTYFQRRLRKYFATYLLESH